jgi:predicted TIM-barrel fold metal-dependent hydrolase
MSDILLKDFQPRPRLTVKETFIEKPRFPVIEAHNHLFPPWDQRTPAELLEVMDSAHVRFYVDLDGGWGEDKVNHRLDTFKAQLGDRYCVFGGVDWSAWADQGNQFGEWAAERLEAQAARGVQGLKIWKPFGLHIKDHEGNLVAIDDRRLDAIWETAGELGLPVLIHVADPVAFFDPLDRFNERWEELNRHPDWHFPSPPYPSFETILNGLATLVADHPNTTFIGAHVGCYAENLGWVGDLLDRCPNFYVDISARIGELGRQPYTARKFFLNHADRILFGTDSAPNVEVYRTYYRFLETDDEYFSYGRGPVPGQGRWQIYGLYLPDDVLQQVYYQNAQRVLPGVAI